MTHEQYFSSRTRSILDLFGRDEVAPVRILRQGQEMTLNVRVRQEAGKRTEIPSATLFPIMFWLMGTVAILFLRPQGRALVTC